MQPESHHAAPEEERNFSGFRILPSGAPVTDTPPFDRLFEEGARKRIICPRGLQLGNRA